MIILKYFLYLNNKKYINLTKNFCSKTVTKSNKWRGVVGLEIHAQIATKSKLFSGAKSDFGSPVNSCVSQFDAAIPGTLPVLNKQCVEAGIKTAAALSCVINSVSMFDRKHYFYADLPSGYQITQQRAPLAQNGVLTFPILVPGKKAYQKSARIHQLQLEQDSGKSLHDDYENRSLVDLNRAGVPLMELVFEPDLSNGEEAAALVKELILILTRLGTCSCKMEEGALRVDANISVHKDGDPLGTRTEVKNIGSIRGVAQAVAYEINRQIKLLDSGKRIRNETRSWDAASKSTIKMRDKETLQDYRFMPEPNLPPLHLNVSGEFETKKGLIDVLKIQKELPKLPKDTRMELKEMYALNEETVIVLVNEPILLSLFTDIMSINNKRSSKIVTNVLLNDLLNICNKHKISIEDCKINSDYLGELIDMLEQEIINLHLARLILQEMITNISDSPRKIADENNWKQITDIDEITKICKEVLETNAKMVQQYKSGKTKILFAIAGEIAKITEQKINMTIVVELLKKLLK